MNQRAKPVALSSFFLEPVALGLDLDHLGAVHEPVDERDDAPGVREDLAPVGEGLARAEQHWLLRVVATGDDLEEQVGVPDLTLTIVRTMVA